MHLIRYFLFFSILISAFSSCIEPYSLDIGDQANEKYVVFGQITDQEGYQTVLISKTSS
ncbi:MAG: DUF4249 family protein, partial [Bacteroidales bacterium]